MGSLALVSLQFSSLKIVLFYTKVFDSLLRVGSKNCLCYLLRSQNLELTEETIIFKLCKVINLLYKSHTQLSDCQLHINLKLCLVIENWFSGSQMNSKVDDTGLSKISGVCVTSSNLLDGLALSLLANERFVNVGNNTTSGNGCLD